jgi:hypothetical protein
MQSRTFSQSSTPPSVRIVAMLFLAVFIVMGSVGTARATGGVPWQVGDVVVCYGGGKCNVLRIHGTSVQLLDTLSDGLLGGTGGTALNNSLHVLATDDKGGGSSKVVVYSIASINPFSGTVLPHSVISTFDGSSGPGSSAAAVAVNNAGHIFVGNANPGGASIVELSANGTPTGNVFTFPVSGTCATTTLGSLDIGANADAIYVSAKDGIIRKVSLPLSASSSCSQFANFGSGVTLYGLKDIPAGALTGNCGAPLCPTDETVLVVAKGFTDPDANETEPPSPSDPDAVNICTNVADQTPVSCALLLDTNPNPGLNSPLWQASNQYFTLNAPILDPSLHLQRVLTAGTSGGQEPNFSETGGTVIDNAVIWTDKAQPAWTANTPFTVTVLPGTPYIVDTNFNLQTVTIAGTSGPTQPTWSLSGTTIDGLVWSDQGAWLANHTFTLGAAVGDSAGHPHTVLTAGTSGSGPLPAGGWNDANGNNGGLTASGVTMDNAAIWTNQGAVTPYTGNHAFALNTLIVDGSGHAQQAVEPGTSGASTSFNPITGGRTIDNAVTWTDQGQEFWHPSFAFGAGAVIVDPAGHVQLVTTAGTSGPSQPIFNDASSTTTDGLQWTDQGVPGSWSAGSHTLNAVILDSNSPKHVQQVVVAGTSGGSAPTFSATGGYTLDGSVVWLDRGVNTYQPSHPYNVGDAFSDGTDVQQATSAGTSGAAAPAFAHSPATVTPDNAVVWTDEGALVWQPNFNYTATSPATTYIVDPVNHVQQVTSVGISGAAQPTFNDGGMTMDATPLVWTDRGRRFWHPSAYAANAIIVDMNSHVQFMTTAGTSGPTLPPFTSNIPGTGQTTDGLQWTDQGAPGTWMATTVFSANQFIVDNSAPTPHVQQVVVGGMSGAGPNPPAFSTTGSYTLDGSVVWLDRGIETYQPNQSYNVGNAFFDATDIQQATSAGTSGASAPAFADTAATVTADNAVVWTDEGTLTWHPNFNYAATSPANTYIVDPANHVQQVTTAGMSGSSIPSPFNDGGTVIDGLVWLDIGPTVTWMASPAFASGTLLVDPGSFLQKVTTAGISGTPTQPSWNEAPLGNTVDGLQWTDQGYQVWQPGHKYFTLGTLISDAATHAQKVTEAGTSGVTTPTFNDVGGTTIDNAVTWTESHPSWVMNHSYVTGNSDTLILDGNSHVQLVSTSGISGPTTPPFTSNKPTTGMTIDGLQWSNQASPATSVAARYPVTGVNTLQSLALDPLVANCTGNSCPSLPLPTRKTANFWLGDSVSGSFYKLNFATGTPITFTGACPTGCGIQSLVIYGGEGANQPGLASLVLNGSLSTGDSFTATANVLQNTITSTLSNNGSGSPPTTPISLYASLVDKTSCFNDPSVGSLACKPTVQADATKALVWKLDVPLNGTTALPTTETLNTSFASVGGFGIDASTDVFVDEQFDDTTFIGTDPGTRTVSVHSLHEVSSVSQTQAHCTFSSPTQNACFKTNRGTLNFIFTCPGLSQTQFQAMHPSLSLVQKNPPQSPKFIPLNGTNGKAPFRFDSSGNFWTFQWSVNGAAAGTYQGTAFDSPGPGDNPPVQSFAVTFQLKSSCP